MPGSASAEDYYPDTTTTADARVYTDAVSVNPAPMVFGLPFGMVSANLQYDHAFTDYVGLSVKGDVALLGIENWGVFSSDDSIFIGLGELGLRIAPGGGGVEGAYIRPFVGAGYASWDEGEDYTTSVAETTVVDDPDSAWILYPGVGAGYGWVWSSGFTLRIGGALGVLMFDEIDDPDEGDDTFTMVMPRVDFGLGYAW